MEPTNLLEWVADTRYLVGFLIIAIPSLMISILGIMFVRAVYPEAERISSRVVSAKVNYMAETYAVVLGLFLVGAFNDFQAMQTVVKTEALALRALHETAANLPTDGTDDIRERIRSYTRTVIAEEWQLMKYGDESSSAQHDLDQIFALISSATSRSHEYQGVGFQAQRLAQEVLTQRAIRLTNGPGDGDTLSGAFSHFLVVLTLIAIALPWFLYTPHPLLHIVTGGALIVVFISSIVLAVKMLYPFAGELAIQPTDFKTALIHMMEQVVNTSSVVAGSP